MHFFSPRQLKNFSECKNLRHLKKTCIFMLSYFYVSKYADENGIAEVVCDSPVQGRYLAYLVPGDGNIAMICEISVCGTGTLLFMVVHNIINYQQHCIETFAY